MSVFEDFSKAILESEAQTPALFLVGPTATGKSAIATHFARESRREIVNADAFQVYAGLDILTGKPSIEERERVPHHLYGYVQLSQSYSAAKYLHDVESCLNELIIRHKKKVLIVGGSGLYIKALTHGLSTLPPSDEKLRAELNQKPLADLVDQLLQLDPNAESSIDLKNPRRVVRALEICLLAKRPVSELRLAWAGQIGDNDSSTASEESGSGIVSRFGPIRGFYLNRERSEMRSLVEARVYSMFRSGVVDEVGELLRVDPELQMVSSTAMGALGFRELVSHRRGQIREADCRNQIITATQQYAKRQDTWFRKQKHFAPIDLTGFSIANLESPL